MIKLCTTAKYLDQWFSTLAVSETHQKSDNENWVDALVPPT